MQRSVMPINEIPERLPEGEPAALPKSVDTPRPGSADKRSDSDLQPELPVPRWLLNLVGHVLAASLGLILGYLILAWLRPLTFPLPWYH
jgi:hypothetical protein